ncbi:acyltransferase [Shewanella algae]|uniref:acyltransferase n=1 Tax=Shewanella algae TaxID=38313 RepID=UPI0016558C91|nr:acyltransferase [Shewanella algae]MBC8796424.1 acyltransferase [Shewanella algae]
MVYFLEKLIQLVKRDPGYRVDKAISFRSVFVVVFERLLSFIFGFFYQIIRLRRPVILFKVPSARISHSHKLYLTGTVTIGAKVDIDCLSQHGVKFGHNVSIPVGTYIRCTGVVSDIGVGLTIGDNSGLGHYNFINAQGGVTIGNNVIVGPYVSFLSENHNFDDVSSLIREQGVSRAGIVIGDNVWIGANVTILDGVEIGEGTVIGAGSIVTKSIPRNSVAVGNPCRVIKSR